MIAVNLAAEPDRADLALVLRAMLAAESDMPDPDAPARAAADLSAPSGQVGPFCMLARDAGRPVGFAAFSGLVPVTGGRWGLFLQLLFVIPEARGRGASRALMAALARFTCDRGYLRLDWNAVPGNAPAIGLYASLGVPVLDRIYYRLQGDLLAQAAGTWPERTA